jgi:hypothetical protein
MASIRTHLLILTCAASAGVHAVLAPAHFEEGAVPGVGFVVVAAALAAVAAVLDRRPHSRHATEAAALLLGGLIAAYVATRITPVPPFAEHVERVDAVGAVTKLVEALGLALALMSITETMARRPQVVATEKGVMS